MNKILTTLFLLFTGLLLAGNAFALSLTLSSGGDTLNFSDGGTGDSHPDDGVLIINGGVGVWTVNVTTGISLPSPTNDNAPYMHLNSIDGNFFQSTAASTLYVTLTEHFDSIADFDALLTGFMFNVGGTIGGTTSGTIAFNVNINGEAYSSAPYAAPSFNGSDMLYLSDFVEENESFDASITAIITHYGAGFTSFDAELIPVTTPDSSVPVPGTISLLAIGLLSFAGITRRKK